MPQQEQTTFKLPTDKKMTEDELRVLLGTKIQQAVDYYNDTFAQFRLTAWRMYNGEPQGNEEPNRSHVVSRDIAEAVDTMMPGLMSVFCSSSDVCQFVARGPQDEQKAHFATEYVNNIIMVRNKGAQIFHDWFKSALLYRIGVIKIWWDEKEDIREDDYTGLSEDEFQALSMDETAEISSIRAYPDPAAMQMMENTMALQMAQQATLAVQMGQQPQLPPQQQLDTSQLPKCYDVHVKRVNRKGFVNIKNVPNEEFLFDRWTADLDDMRYVGHRRRRTRSDLLQMGYDPALVDKCSFGVEQEYQIQEKMERFLPEYAYPWQDEYINDPSMSHTWLTESYIRVDWDGDGIAEYRKITTAGGTGEYVILDNEPCDTHPFAILTPIPTPFKMVGQAITDQVKDLQLIKTTLLRQGLDNFYLSTHQRHVVNPSNVNLDDLLNPRPGGIVRAQNPAGDVVPLASPQIGTEVLNWINYVDTVRESRTGITRASQGLDADVLDPMAATATGASLLQSASNKRMELIARIFAESGVSRACRRVLQLVTQHQNKADAIKMNGVWVPMAPRDWDAEFDVVVNVGLGTGNKDQELHRIMALFPLVQQLIQMQAQLGGPQTAMNGPLLNLSNVYNMLTRLVQAMGLKSVDQYFTDPKLWFAQQAQQRQMQPPQPQQPPPELQAAMMELKERAREFDAKNQYEHVKLQTTTAMKRQQLQQEFQARMAELDLQDKKEQHDRAMDLTNATLEQDHQRHERAVKLTDLDLAHRQNMQQTMMAGAGNSNTNAEGDTVTLDIPLLIRILEVAREDLTTDVQLHNLVEKLIGLRGHALTMSDYPSLHIKGQ